jgi:hypothetical protein
MAPLQPRPLVTTLQLAHPMRISLALLALTLSGCAAASTPAADVAASPTTQIRKTGTGIDVVAANDAVAIGSDLPLPVDRVWDALPRAYTAIAIPVLMVDPASHTLGNINFHPHGSLQGQRISSFLDCGSTGVSGAPVADVYSVRMSVRSHVVAATGGSRVETTVTGAARNMDGTGSSEIHCVSTGKLENALSAAVVTSLGS